MVKSRERILVEGLRGSSKTYQFLKIAKWLLPTGAHFRIIDTDDSYLRMLEEEFPELHPENTDQVHLYSVFEWPEYVAAKDDILKQEQPGDWIVLDMAHMAWKAVTDYFVEEVFKKDIGNYFLEARKQLAEKGDRTARGKEAKNLGALKGWLDWPVINKMYDSFILPLVYRSKSHLYIATSASPVSSEDDELTRDLYGPFGVKPAGQKDLGHQVHSEFLFQQGKDFDTWEFSTIKDRGGRRRFDHVRLVNFPLQYLVAVAKWEV